MASDVPRARPLRPKVGVVAWCSPLEVGAEQGPAAAGALAALLSDAGCEVVPAGALGGPDQAAATGRRFAEEHVEVVAGVAVSWYEDYLALDLLEECAVPLVLWSLPGMETGALCGTQQLTCALKQMDRPFEAVFGALQDADCLARALAAVRAASLSARLRRARIGLAGTRVGGMSHTSPNESALKAALGPRVVPLDLPALIADAEAADRNECAAIWQRLRARAGRCSVQEADGLDSVGFYLTLRQRVAIEGLDALSVGCYPDLMGRVCLASSLLADDGVPMACEGDVHGAVGQLALGLLTDGPTHNTDWLNPLDDGSVIFSHCGAGSLALADRPGEVELGPVRLMHRGACARYCARPGPVTLVSLSVAGDGYQMAVLEGEALPTEMVFPGNPLRVRFAQPLETLHDWIHDEGVAHHWMAGYGHVARELRLLARFAGPRVRWVSL